MALFLPQRWRRQPQGPVEIDWGNPLAEPMLAMGWIEPSMVCGASRNLDRPARSAILASSEFGVIFRDQTAVLMPKPTTVSYNVTTTNARCEVKTFVPPAQTKLGFFIRVWGDSLSHTTYGRSVFRQDDGQSYIQCAVERDTGIVGVRLSMMDHYYVASYSERWSVANPGPGRYVDFAVLWSAGAGMGYANGALVTGSLIESGRTETPPALNGWGSAHVDDNVRNAWTPVISWAPAMLGYGDRMTKQLVDAAHENPWQIFKPLRPIFYSLSSVSFQFARPSSDILVGAWQGVAA